MLSTTIKFRLLFTIIIFIINVYINFPPLKVTIEITMEKESQKMTLCWNFYKGWKFGSTRYNVQLGLCPRTCWLVQLTLDAWLGIVGVSSTPPLPKKHHSIGISTRVGNSFTNPWNLFYNRKGGKKHSPKKQHFLLEFPQGLEIPSIMGGIYLYNRKGRKKHNPEKQPFPL